MITQLEMMSHVPRVFGPSCQYHGGRVELWWKSVDVDWSIVVARTKPDQLVQ